MVFRCIGKIRYDTIIDLSTVHTYRLANCCDYKVAQKVSRYRLPNKPSIIRQRMQITESCY